MFVLKLVLCCYISDGQTMTTGQQKKKEQVLQAGTRIDQLQTILSPHPVLHLYTGTEQKKQKNFFVIQYVTIKSLH